MNASLDPNFWGIFAMPVGILLCYGATIVAWLIVEAHHRHHPGGKRHHP